MLAPLLPPFTAKEHITEHTYDGKKPCTVVLRSTTDLPATVTDEGGVYKANGTDDVLVLKGSLGGQLNVLKTEPFDDSDVAVDEKLVRRIKALTETEDVHLARTMAAFLKRKRSRPRKVAGCVKLLKKLAKKVLPALLAVVFFFGGVLGTAIGTTILVQKQEKQSDSEGPAIVAGSFLSIAAGGILWERVFPSLEALFESFKLEKECAAICVIIVVVLCVAIKEKPSISMPVAGAGLTVAMLLATR